jgi:hypothetical protein
MFKNALERFAECQELRQRERLWCLARYVGCFALCLLAVVIMAASVTVVVKTIWSAMPTG